MENQTVKVNINGSDYEVAAGQNVLEACRSVGIEIPHFCYHPNLKIAGSCRMCLVYTGMPARDRATGQLLIKEDGSCEIAWAPKPAIACGTNVAQSMHIRTRGEDVDSCRKGVLEFLLLNHPLDCPICDKAGECKLQEFAHAYGAKDSRFVEKKNVKPKKVEVCGKIIVDSERCIQCSRCIRFCNEFIGKGVFGFTKRGSKTEIAVYPEADNDSNYLLNVVDGCPVGALTEKEFRFKMRTWFLKVSDSICAESSAGVNTRVWSREGKIYRITPRRNQSVNEVWMSDSGRYVFKRFAPENRLSVARIDSSPCEVGYAADRCVEIMKLGGLAIVANAWQTVEEQFVISQLAKECNANVYMASHLGEDDGKLVSADRTPNMRGAFITGLIKEYPKQDLSELAEKVRAGEIKTVLCFREDLKDLGFEARDFKSVNIIYCGALENDTSLAAKICIPMRGEFEKDGMWINRQFRIQRFEKAIDAPSKSLDDLGFLLSILKSVSGQSFNAPTLSQMRKTMCDAIPALKGCENIGPMGKQLDASAFSGIEFPETDAMHFKKNVGGEGVA